MSAVLVDTDVVSYAFRQASEYDLYRDLLSERDLFLSFAMFAELVRGTLKASWGQRRRDRLTEFIQSRFAILNTNRQTCIEWAAVHDEARRIGRVMGCADAWVAATAIAADVPLVSHNRRHFEFLDRLDLISFAPQ